MSDMKKVLSYLGLAQRAGMLVSGEFMVERALKDGDAKVVIIGMDASENTTKKFINACDFRSVPYRVCSSKEELGHAIGKEIRVVCAVIDNGFAQAILKCF